MGSGTLDYSFAAPELIRYTKDDTDDSEDSTARTQESDIYSFGCLYYEVSYIKYNGALAKLLARIA